VNGAGDESGGSIDLVNSSQAWLTSGKLTSGYILSIRRVRPLTQDTDIRNQGDFFPESHEDEFDKLTMVDQQQQDELDRSFKLPETIDPADFDASLPPDITDLDSAGKAIVVNATADGLELSTTSFAGADSLFLNDVVYLTFANSPYTVSESDRGSLLSVDTSGGAVSILLPAISGLDLTEAFVVSVRKQTSDTNAVSITRNGTDTINLATAVLSLPVQTNGYILVPDKGPSPDDWQALGFRDVLVAGAVVGTTDSQSLSNKTLVAPVISTFEKYTDQGSDPATPASGFKNVYGKSAGIFYIDSSGNVRQLVNLNEAQTLTNKTLTSPVLTTPSVDVEIYTDQGSDPSAPSAGFKKLYAKAAGIFYRTSAAIRQFANLDEAQVFTAKDYDGGTASNSSRMTIPKDTLANLTALTRKAGTIVYATDTDKFYKDNGSSLAEVGSGGSGINYVANPSFDSAATSWNTYADAAADSPVDGTGGSPNVTITRSTSSPLRSSGMGVLTKDAANRQGQGVSTDFTIDLADKAKVLNVSFDYAVSAAFVSGDSSDVRVWVYDVTNAVLIPVSPYTIQGGTGNNFKFTGVFQSASNSTSYRLILHVATTNASAWTMNLDNVIIGPQIQLYGAPIGDWTAYTPTFVGLGTVSAITGYYRRVGDSVHVMTNFTVGTTTGVAASISLPSGMSIDTAKAVASTTSGPGPIVGKWSNDGNANQEGHIITATTTSATVVYFGNIATSTTKLVAQLGNSFINNSSNASATFIVPVAGFSSTVLMSNDTDTRVVAALYESNTARSISNAAANTAEYLTEDKIFDTHNAFNNATNIYTVPVAGLYRVAAHVSMASGGGWGVGEALSVRLYKNAVLNRRFAASMTTAANTESIIASGSVLVSCVAGDTLEVRLLQASGAALNTDGNEQENWVSFERLTGPSAIAATEKIYLQYTGNGGAAQTATTTNMDWATKVVDSHGAWSGTVFTAPRAGWYIFDMAWNLTAGVNTSLNLYLNGTSTLFMQTTSTADTQHSSKFSKYLNAGDLVSFRIQNNATLSNSATNHWLSIYSQG
jgi:hypothetical protein